MRFWEILKEYKARGKVGVSGPIKLGNTYKDQWPVVNTPISHLYEVRVDNNSTSYPEYYFYNKETGVCVGQFALNTLSDEADEATPAVKPGVRIVQPHMTLAQEVQGKGLGSLIYRTFLAGGNWVFATYSHSKGAGALWDKLAKGDIVSVFYDPESQQFVEPGSKESRGAVRLLGPKNRFKNQQGVAENFADGKVKGQSRPGRVKRAGASCAGSVTDLRAKAKKYSGERGKMYHWCANMKGGKK